MCVNSYTDECENIRLFFYFSLLQYDEGWEMFKASFEIDEELFNSMLGKIQAIDLQVKLV